MTDVADRVRSNVEWSREVRRRREAAAWGNSDSGRAFRAAVRARVEEQAGLVIGVYIWGEGPPRELVGLNDIIAP